MGDRGNVVILTRLGQAVVLYTHWGGSTLPIQVRDALAKRWRWDDPSYLARIVFDQMTEEAHGAATGFGISANEILDNEYPILVLDPRGQRIASRPDPYLQSVEAKTSAAMEEAAKIFTAIDETEGLTFEDFIRLTDDAVVQFRDAAEGARPPWRG